jgi:hypothetical protein
MQDTTRGHPKPMGKRGAFVADNVAAGIRRPKSKVAAAPEKAKPSG